MKYPGESEDIDGLAKILAGDEAGFFMGQVIGTSGWLEIRR